VEWKDRIQLQPLVWDTTKTKLAYDSSGTHRVVLGSDVDNLEVCEFTVLNGNIKEKTPAISSLVLPQVCVTSQPSL
jgi:hypothetical protein